MNYSVYIHTNKTNNKKYIGITCRKPEVRWGNNGSKYKSNKYFYSAIQKYGWDNFKHEVILVNLTKEQAEMFEVEMIKYYKSNQREFGYNIASGGHLGTTGLKLSDETRKKISLKNRGRKVSKELKEWLSKSRKGDKNPMYGKKQSQETIEKRIKRGTDHWKIKSIICLENLKVYDFIMQASRELNISYSHIIQVCKGTRKSAGGLHFKYMKDYNPNIDYDLTLSDNQSKQIYCIELNKFFNSIHEAGRELNIDYRSISSVLTGRYNTTHNLRFVYAKDLTCTDCKYCFHDYDNLYDYCELKEDYEISDVYKVCSRFIKERR